MSPAGLLRLREQSWSARIRSGQFSLLAEDSKTKTKHAEQALGLLGKFYGSGSPVERTRLLRRFPAVHVVTTTRVATEHYDSGAFWPSLFRLAGLPQDQNIQSAWGKAYIANLAALDLETFADTEEGFARFVGPILMHSGVPTYCLPDYFTLVTQRRRSAAGLTPSMFVSWAKERVAHDRLPGVDKPVQRFLRHGGEFAVDVTDRVFELLDSVASGGDGSHADLPDRFRETAIRMRDQGEDLKVRHYAGASELDLRQPEIRLDPYGRGVFLRLPSIPDAPDGQVTWVVAADDDERRVTSVGLVPGFREPAPQVDEPLVRPVRRVSAHLEGSQSLAFTLPVVEAERPVLAFDDTGEQLVTTRALPGGPTWLVTPEGQQPHIDDQPLAPVAEALLPLGWDGWSLRLYDLDQIPQFTLGGERYAIRTASRPRISMPEPVAGVRTLSGDPVFPQLPVISLPVDAESITWTISVTDSSGKAIYRDELSGSGELLDLNPVLHEALCDDLHVRVRGPWGRGTSRHLTVVSGLTVVSSPAWRPMTRRGLVPAEATVAAASGVRLSETRLSLDERTPKRWFNVWVRTEKLRLVLEPAHMSVAVSSAGRGARESVRPLQLTTEEILDDAGTLLVTIGEAAEPRLHLLGRNGLAQTLEPHGLSRNGVYRFDLRQLTDTLRTLQTARLALDPDEAVPVASIRPRRLFSEITVEDDELILADAVPVEGLSAICYPTRAPWLPPALLAVEDGRAQLPQALRDAGDLLVMVRIEDPWAPEPQPSWPRKADRIRVPATGHLRHGAAEEVALSAYLAGVGEIPTNMPDCSLLWLTFDRLWSLGLGQHAPQVDEQLRQIFLDDPGRSLRDLARSDLDAWRIPRLLSRAGLLTTAPPQPVAGETVWRRGNVIPLTWLGGWRLDEDELDGLHSICGDGVTRIVTEGADPHARVGAFDDTTRVLVRMNTEQRQQIYSAARIVPKGLLDEDSRSAASAEVLEVRDDPSLGWLVRNVAFLSQQLDHGFRSAGFQAGLDAMEARRYRGASEDWMAIPEWSIGMACALRLAARRPDQSLVSTSGLRAFEDLARKAPTLASIDLVLAELLVSGPVPREAS